MDDPLLMPQPNPSVLLLARSLIHAVHPVKFYNGDKMPYQASTIQNSTGTSDNSHLASADELQEALRSIASLISKSEKARQKLAVGTWQHTMLQNNLKALYIASALLNNKADHMRSFTRDDLEEALHSLAAMISKTQKAQAKLSPGTSQHTLLKNRLKALLISEALLKSNLG